MALPIKNSTRPRQDARVVKSRAALRTALLELVSEAPFEEISVAAITARAGIGYATFFRHYPGRDALLAETADELIVELASTIAPLVSKRDTGAAALALAQFVDRQRDLCRALLVGAGNAMRNDITLRARAIADAVDVPMSPWLPRDLGIDHGVAATLTILRWGLTEDPAPGVAELASLIDRLVFIPMFDGDRS